MGAPGSLAPGDRGNDTHRAPSIRRSRSNGWETTNPGCPIQAPLGWGSTDPRPATKNGCPTLAAFLFLPLGWESAECLPARLRQGQKCSPGGGCGLAPMSARTVAFRGGVHRRGHPVARKGREKGCARGAGVVQNFPERRAFAPNNLSNGRFWRYFVSVLRVFAPVRSRGERSNPRRPPTHRDDAAMNGAQPIVYSRTWGTGCDGRATCRFIARHLHHSSPCRINRSRHPLGRVAPVSGTRAAPQPLGAPGLDSETWESKIGGK
jgi:hypothetical protein